MTISLLGYAILSLLARLPLSGYDLAREMKKPHSFFFGQAQLSQIYPELARLEAAELVASQIIEQRGRPDRKVYSIRIRYGWPTRNRPSCNFRSRSATIRRIWLPMRRRWPC